MREQVEILEYQPQAQADFTAQLGGGIHGFSVRAVLYQYVAADGNKARIHVFQLSNAA